jgi:hypothetical protein
VRFACFRTHTHGLGPLAVLHAGSLHSRTHVSCRLAAAVAGTVRTLRRRENRGIYVRTVPSPS